MLPEDRIKVFVKPTRHGAGLQICQDRQKSRIGILTVKWRPMTQLVIPNAAVKFILLQRTGYLKFGRMRVYRLLIRVVGYEGIEGRASHYD